MFWRTEKEYTSGPYMPTTVQVQAVEACGKVHPDSPTAYVTVSTEVIEIRAERIAKSANPLALIATAQPYSDNYYQAPKPQRSNATSSSTRPSATTRHKGKEIANPVTPQSESVSEEDSDPEQARRDKDMKKNLALKKKRLLSTSRSCTNLPTTTFELLSNSPGTRRRLLHQDNNDHQSGQFGNQRTITAGNAECQSGFKDYLTQREKMMMCKQSEQELGEAHYSYMAKISEAHLKNPVLLENKTILKQLKKANASVTQELEKCKTNLDETNSALKEAISCRDSCLIALQNKQNEFEKLSQREQNSHFALKVKEDKDIDKMIEMDKQLKFLNEIVYTRNQSIQTIHMLAPKCSTYNGRPTFANPRFEKLKSKTEHGDKGVKETPFPGNKRESLLKLSLINQPVVRQPKCSTIVQLILFIVDSGCTKHMTGNLKLLCNFVEKFLGTVRFGNDQFAPILGYGDLIQGNVTIKRVYYVEGLNHNLFSVGQFCDADLEVAFRKSTCFVRDLQGNDLLTGNRGSDLYTISLQETTSSTPICFMAKASPTQAWLWHRRLSHLNFDYITLLSKKDK
ncbi:retrovirus-related pol polyprotein from transposon TNT 1-94 [Tanacetum coccineum]